MRNEKNNSVSGSGSFRDYIDLIRNNLITIILVSASFLIATTIYTIIAPNIYKSSITLKISAPKGNILSSQIGELQDFGGVSNDRYIANEIETIFNSTIPDEVTEALIDSFNVKKNVDDFSLIMEKSYFQSKGKSLKSFDQIAYDLGSTVTVTQRGVLDFIDIKCESQSPKEAALIANIFAKKYHEYNLRENRKQITVIKEFLGEQLKEKQEELFNAEDAIKSYQLNKGGVELDRRAQLLVSKLADFESQKNTAKIEMSISKEKLNQYKSELEKKDPSISNFLASKSSEPYLKRLQEQIADQETQRDIALASSKTIQAKENVVKEFNAKIKALKDQLDRSMTEYRSQILSSSPEEVKALSQKTFEEEVNYQSLAASYSSMSNVINSYESEFNKLPSSTLELARLERKRLFEENIYSTLSEKYQEAQLNEQATLGNVTILNRAYPSRNPSKPNRVLIIIIGSILGLGFAFGYVYVKNYFDKTIKSPEDIESRNINVVAWIPKVKDLNSKGKDSELILLQKPDAVQSESFRTLRTRLQFSKYSKNAKTFLITSSAPGEGKTIISINLAISFAQANNRTVIVDCDMRKPRVHSVFKENESPGFLDYLFGKLSFENIIRKSEIRNLDFITPGTIPSNPSEILGSKVMKAFIQKLKDEYDIVIIDSPPIIAVSDSEIISRFVDASILVVSANSTEVEWLQESSELLKNEQNSFVGVVLNNFNYKTGYHAYYKYYQHYSKNPKGNKSNSLKRRVS